MLKWDKKKAGLMASAAAVTIMDRLTVDEDPIGLILGTGWGDALQLNDAASIPFGEIPGFDGLADIEGHERRVICGNLGDRTILALGGRVHLNEHPFDPAIPVMVRLQTEMLVKAGVKTLIVTCAAGSLDRDRLPPGFICVTDGFVTEFAPAMPMFAGEFFSPDDALDHELIRRAAYQRARPGVLRHRTSCGGHVMMRGPFFEGRMYDKAYLAKTGALTVGMSTLPEACVAAVYGVKVLALAYVSNDEVEEHSHEENLRRAREDAVFLSSFLTRVIGNLPKD